MKKIVILIIMAVTIGACGGKKQEKVTTSDQVNLVDQYLKLKDALVATNTAEAKMAAATFLKVNNNESLTSALKVISSTNDVAAQRVAFEELSMNMYSIVKTSGTNTTLYKQYCPMAFNNKGAYWLASEEEVNNPYFGDVMLHCGSVQETITQ